MRFPSNLAGFAALQAATDAPYYLRLFINETFPDCECCCCCAAPLIGTIDATEYTPPRFQGYKPVVVTPDDLKTTGPNGNGRVFTFQVEDDKATYDDDCDGCCCCPTPEINVLPETVYGWVLSDSNENVIATELFPTPRVVSKIGDKIEVNLNFAGSVVPAFTAASGVVGALWTNLEKDAAAVIYSDAQIALLFPPWASLTEYVVGQLVTQSATKYACLVAHTAGTFATDLAAAKWAEAV